MTCASAAAGSRASAKDRGLRSRWALLRLPAADRVQREPRRGPVRVLFRFLFRVAGALAGHFAADAALHADPLAMVRALLGADHVLGHRFAPPLQQFLESALGVAARVGGGGPGERAGERAAHEGGG